MLQTACLSDVLRLANFYDVSRNKKLTGDM